MKVTKMPKANIVLAIAVALLSVQLSVGLNRPEAKRLSILQQSSEDQDASDETEAAGLRALSAVPSRARLDALIESRARKSAAVLQRLSQLQQESHGQVKSTAEPARLTIKAVAKPRKLCRINWKTLAGLQINSSFGPGQTNTYSSIPGSNSFRSSIQSSGPGYANTYSSNPSSNVGWVYNTAPSSNFGQPGGTSYSPSSDYSVPNSNSWSSVYKLETGRPGSSVSRTSDSMLVPVQKMQKALNYYISCRESCVNSCEARDSSADCNKMCDKMCGMNIQAAMLSGVTAGIEVAQQIKPTN
ncbi:hypothetical protein HDE_11031 [Halotydeus destructor]|nr:hypothetical protein HDE_11031 [Halotydeus destructor]